jgi:glycerol-3-phosphate dehydrogenase
LTAGRIAGEEVAREAWLVLKGAPVPERGLGHLPGGDFQNFESYWEEMTDRYRAHSPDRLKYLIGRYGTRFSEVLRWIDENPAYGERVLPDEEWVFAEAAHAVHQEMTLSLNDFLWRRTRWARLRQIPDGTVGRIAGILGEHLRWSQQQVDQQLDAFKTETAAHRGI